MRSRVVVQDAPDAPLEVRECDLTTPAGRYVRVRLRSSGVCHSQLTTMTGERSGPVLLGHEGYGTVEEIGPDARSVTPGDTVVVTWVARDDPDDHAPAGPARVELLDGRSATSPHVYTWAEHCTVDERFLVPVPASYPHEPAAALLGCAVLTGAGAVATAFGVGPEDVVAVLGVGGVGLCAVHEAVRRSATVIAVDIDGRKLDLARALGADHTVDSTRDDPVAAIRGIATGYGSPGAGVALDCVGIGPTLDQALKSVREAVPGRHAGGRVGLIGLPNSLLTIDAEHLLRTSKTLVGISGGNCRQADITAFFAWLTEPGAPLGRIVTETAGLDSVAAVVDRLRSGRIVGRALLEM